MAKGAKNVGKVLPLGSMARSTGAAKVRQIIYKTTVVTEAQSIVLRPFGGPSLRGLYANGRYTDFTVAGSLADIFPSSISNITDQYDMYRISNVEVFATATSDETSPSIPPEPINFSVLSSVDLDDGNTINFDLIRTRINLNLVTLTNSLPTQMLASFKPRGNYINNPSGSTPFNAIPSGNSWYDVSAKDQQFVGLKVHVSTPSSRDSRIQVFVKVSIELKGQL